MSKIGLRLTRDFLVVVVSVTSLFAQTKISPAEAAGHIGEDAVVCGSVASTKFAARSKGTPTFINLDRPYPNQVFTALIWGENRPLFGRPEDTFLGKRVCVTGTISSYRGVPEIVVRTAHQIRVQGQ